MKKSKLEEIIHKDFVLKQALNDSRITRRDFLAFTGAMGMSATLGGALWSGRALAAGPKRGGHIVSGLNDANTSDSLDCGLMAILLLLNSQTVMRTVLHYLLTTTSTSCHPRMASQTRCHLMEQVHIYSKSTTLVLRPFWIVTRTPGIQMAELLLIHMRSLQFWMTPPGRVR